MEGGWVSGGDMFSGAGIGLYGFGFILLPEDAALSVMRAGLRPPTAWGGGAVGSRQAQKQIRLYLHITLDKPI